VRFYQNKTNFMDRFRKYKIRRQLKD